MKFQLGERVRVIGCHTLRGYVALATPWEQEGVFEVTFDFGNLRDVPYFGSELEADTPCTCVACVYRKP